ncbi:transcriptional regulator [Clostridia bacterium]|nr:transcriptional regulator [Clostridia bacterium]
MLNETGVAANSDVTGSLPEAKDLRKLAEFFRIVGNEMRIKILLLLSGERLRVCDIAKAVDTSVSATSHQLGMLRQARLVRYDKVGKVVYYSLDDEHITTVFRCALEHVTERK